MERRYEDMHTTIVRLFAGHDLEGLYQDAYTALRATAIHRCIGSLVSDVDAIYLIEAETRYHSRRNDIVNLELVLPVHDAVWDLGSARS